MAKVFSEGSGKAADTADHHQTILHVSESGPVHLPDGIDAGSLDMARDGQNLVLTAPNGDTIIVENYFSGLEAPALVSSSGALLSPALIESFLKTAGDVQVASNNQSSDNSAVGEVSEVTGHGTVTHADGSKETIVNGTKIFEHDIVETDAKGAVNIKFSDESTFAVSQNARMAIDDFSFNAHDQSGTTGISILRGVFMFTSGLIGRENPDAVHLETPVGSIGIRGTIIGGQIHENGKAQISVLEGAIVVHNGTGEQILSSQFETVQLTGFNAPISNVGQLNAQSMTTSYGAVSSVSQQLFTSIQDTAREAQPQHQQQQQQEKAAPATQGDTPQSDSGHGDAAPQAAAQQPASAAAAQATTTQTAAPAADAPVFQTLSTGSGIDGSLSASQSTTPAPAPVAAAPAPVVVVAPVAAPIAAPVQTVQVQTPQPVPNAVFVGGAHVAEQTTGVVVGTLGLTSAYNAPVTYSLVDNHNGLFSVSNTGVVTIVGTSGDYESGLNHYDIVVRATRTDSSLFTDTKLTVDVTDVDEAPVFNVQANPVLNMLENAVTTLNASGFGAHDPENGNITYTVSQNEHLTIKVNGQDATTFTQSDLSNGLVTMTQDGSEGSAAGFTLTASDAAGNLTSRHFTANVTNVDDPMVLAHNAGTMDEGTSHVISGTFLQYTDVDNTPSQIVYTVNSVLFGTLKLNDTTLAVGSHFTQADIDSGKISFQHNGTESAPGVPNNGVVTYTVNSAVGDTQTGTLTLQTNEVNDHPIDQHTASGTLDVSGTIPLTATLLNYTDEESSAAQLVYKLNSATHGKVQVQDANSAWHDLAANGTFTQADINAGHVRFVENGDNVASASVSYTLTDSSAYSENHTLILSINQPATVSSITAGPAFVETPDATTLGNNTMVATLALADPAPSLNAYTFSVLTDSGHAGTFTADSRFQVSMIDGAYRIIAKQGAAFNRETEGTIHIQVSVTDGGNAPVTSGTFNLNVTDANDSATSFNLNNGEIYKTGVTSEMSGRSIIGILTSNDPDLQGGLAANRPLASQYHVTSVTNASGNVLSLSTSNFEIVDRTRQDGTVEQILRLKDNFVFGTNGDTYTVTVTLATPTGTLSNTFTVLGRNDTMMLHNVDNDTGVHITNDLSAGAHFGSSFTFTDVTGDGVAELVIGAPGSNNGQGTVYALKTNLSNVLGALQSDSQISLAAMTSSNNTVLFTGAPSGSYGSKIVSLSHFDAQSGSSFATTIPGSGKVEIDHVVGGGVLVTTVVNVPAATAGTALVNGITIASIGDVNHDGYSDMLIGSASANSGTGAVGLLLGSATSSSTVDWANVLKLGGATTGSAFGAAVTGIGDINGDGINDFAVSATNYNNASITGAGEGQVLIYYGSATQTSLLAADVTINTSLADNHLGQIITSAGDFNGDGYSDMMISRDAIDDGRGAITLMFGSNHISSAIDSQGSINTTAGFQGATIHYNATNTAVHVANFAAAGDFNGDGYDDIAVDLSKTNTDGTFDHTVYVIYGNALGTANYDLNTLTTTGGAYKLVENGTHSSQLTLQSIGDINGDGLDDIMIGDPNANNGNGEATLVYGIGSGTLNVSGTNTYTATGNNQSYIGTGDNNTLDNGTYTNLSFHSNGGNDTFVIHNTAAIRQFEGGAGTDTIKLFFSAGETTGAVDAINLSGLSNKTSSVERIEFDTTSKQDSLTLSINDVINMAQSSGDVVGGMHRLTIAFSGTSLSGDENRLNITDSSGNAISNLATQTGFNHFDNSGTATGADGHTYAVYTNTAASVQLLVDTHLASATSLATASV